tara:strand:- start:210 stop:560 length:351 start_codon:yes stop_codon:yes gene_type:complete
MESPDIEEFELTIAEARKHTDLADALERLGKNKDFKSLILTGYLEEEAVRLVALKAVPQMLGDDMQKKILTSIDGIGALTQYFSMINNVGAQAQIAIEDANEAIVDIGREEDEGRS